MGCNTPKKKLENLLNKYPELAVSKDTSFILKGDTIFKERKIVEIDSLYLYIDKHCDTTYKTKTIIQKIKIGCNPTDSVVIDSTGIKIKAVYKNGNLFLKYEKEPQEIKYVVRKIYATKESKWYDNGHLMFNITTLLLILIVYVVWRIFK